MPDHLYRRLSAMLTACANSFRGLLSPHKNDRNTPIELSWTFGKMYRATNETSHTCIPAMRLAGEYLGMAAYTQAADSQ